MTFDVDWLEPAIREVASPLTPRMLRSLDPRCHTVQFSTPLKDDDHRILGEWLSAYPAVTLRAYGSVPDLEWLRFYPQLRRFSADALFDYIESFEGLRHLRPDLHSLTLGSTRRTLSLQALTRFTARARRRPPVPALRRPLRDQPAQPVTAQGHPASASPAS